MCEWTEVVKLSQGEVWVRPGYTRDCKGYPSLDESRLGIDKVVIDI